MEDASNSLHSEGDKAAELDSAVFLTYHNRENLAECRKAADISCTVEPNKEKFDLRGTSFQTPGVGTILSSN